MSQNILNDLSKVYLEQIAVDEAVKGQDTEMRKAASAERRAGDTLTKKLPPSKGKQYGQYQKDQISYVDKKTKGKHIIGLAREAVDQDKDGDNDFADVMIARMKASGKKTQKQAVAATKNKSYNKEEFVAEEDPCWDGYTQVGMKKKGGREVPNCVPSKGVPKAKGYKKESFSNWRQDLAEVMDKIEKEEDQKQIKEKKNINNKVVINPDFKEAVEELGGVLIESVEVDEAYQPISKEKENRMYRRAGNLARTSLSSRGKKKEEAQTKSAKIVSAITRQSERKRFDEIGKSPVHNEGFVDPEHGEAPSGRTPLENVSDHPKASVRKTAVKGFKKQMSKEYGGSWKSRSSDPVSEEFELEEAEGSYGRTPKATAAYGALANKRRAKPASEYSQRGEKKTKVTSAERHATRSQRTAADHSGKKSTKPAWHSYQRSNMTQKDRDHLRGQSEYGHVGYDGDGGGGSKPKGKKLERQQKTGVSAESYINEKTLTPAETKKKEEIVMSMKKSASDFEKRYPGRGKEVMYATATKQAKKLAEADMPQETQNTDKRAKTQQKQKLLQILQQKERAVRAGMTDINASYEVEGEVLDERRREDKGKPRPAEPSAAFKAVSKLMGSSRMGVQPRGEKKVPGRKQPSIGQSPAQRVATRRAAAQASQSLMHSPRD